MRGILTESEKGYYDLRVNGRMFATNDWRVVISNTHKYLQYKLNGIECETIILEETTRKFLREKYFTKDNQIDNESSFEWGYLSALEDNQDKLFTIEDVLKELNKINTMPNSILDTFTDNEEMITIKSDDVSGRSQAYEAIVKNAPIKKPNIPESFNVLIKELQAI